MKVIGRTATDVIAQCRCGCKVSFKRALLGTIKDCGCVARQRVHRAAKRYRSKSARMARLRPILSLVSDAYNDVKLAPRGEARAAATLRLFRLLSRYDLDLRADVFKALESAGKAFPVQSIVIVLWCNPWGRSTPWPSASHCSRHTTHDKELQWRVLQHRSLSADAGDP